MTPEEKLVLLAELANQETFCQLNHKHDPSGPNQPAADFICLPVGYNKSKIEAVAVREMVIPVCQECANSLSSQDEWILLYCLECCQSQWVNKNYSRLSYLNQKLQRDHKVIWLSGCPKCTGEMKAVWFE